MPLVPFESNKLFKVPDLTQPWSTTTEGQRAETKLKTNPYDLDAWGVLIREAQVNTYLDVR